MTRRGSCLCGAVTYEVAGEMKPVVACHCHECRKQSGHHFAASETREAALTLQRKDGLAWYKASGFAARAFCKLCGSTLFWSRDGSPLIHVLAGTLDAPTGLRMRAHMWTSQKGDYYEIADGLRQVEGDDI